MLKKSILFIALAFALASCSPSSPSAEPDDISSPVSQSTLSDSSSQTSSPSSTTVENDAGNATSVKVGLGIVATTDESTAASGEEAGNAKTNVAVCALAVDESGTILSVKFDTVQTEIGFDVLGALIGDTGSEVQTKKERGDSYLLKEVSGIGKEWYEQIAALENWMVGKSVGDVLQMKVYKRDDDHTHVPDEEDLKSSVTISVTDQLRALEKAFADAQ